VNARNNDLPEIRWGSKTMTHRWFGIKIYSRDIFPDSVIPINLLQIQAFSLSPGYSVSFLQTATDK